MTEHIKVEDLGNGVYDFRELVQMEGRSEPLPAVDSYLVIGTARAALIDTLESAEGLYEAVRKVTDLPLDVLITHGHGDHAGVSLKEFAKAGCTIYMSMLEFECLQAMNPDARREWITDLSDGQKFVLGGRILKTIMCPGHTEGSAVFLDADHHLLFSGDAIGSGGFWMQLPMSTSLTAFDATVHQLYEVLKEHAPMTIYPGHRYQSPGTLNESYAEDVCMATDQIISGKLVGTDQMLEIGGMKIPYRTVSYGQVHDYCYNPKKL
ncbi:MAG: MBL fold metallo-hydrolase [Solobacterium sp.]|jgi:glyoxylase-like metal-dependent hydrolase (beta-lactamase superfamily II)|nr:MBL fold metallo-hydrolase [Solobacterium sp.]MCH4265927.1 MBL fold metallo-hydrolase [Solobacterium sp.]